MNHESTPAVLGLSEGLGAWLPIATAPRDRTWILLTGGTIDRGWDNDTKPAVVVGQSAGDERWQFAWYDSGYYGEYEEPTHWMPLPAAPNAKLT